MEFRMIKSPTPDVLDMILKRISLSIDKEMLCTDAIGLVQGRVIDMLFVADIAQKTANVNVYDVRGNCPQNIILLAIFGDTTSVETAISQIKERL